jgi:hypothetical protein
LTPDVHDLASLAVAWIREILPVGVTVDVDRAGTIWWGGWEPLDRASASFGFIAVQEEVPLREGLSSAMLSLLDGIQDHISESPPREPWPVVPGHPRQLPLPEVEIDPDGNVTAGYMWDGRWVLRGPPLVFPLE